MTLYIKFAIFYKGVHFTKISTRQGIHVTIQLRLGDKIFSGKGSANKTNKVFNMYTLEIFNVLLFIR